MMKLTIYKSVLLVALSLTLTQSLTDDEISQFQTTGHVEKNTGLIGWVSVTKFNDGTLVMESNDIPDHDTGIFPNRDNPNNIVEQWMRFLIPDNPVEVTTPQCLPMGPMGMLTNGVPLFNVYDANFKDAVIYEVFDDCLGHPDESNQYHYHQTPICILDRASSNKNVFLGVAFDGYPIYGPVDKDGRDLTSADLDVCHGRYDDDGQYRYYMTRDYPYTLGCFHGYVKASRVMCLYACNLNGTDKNDDHSFCDNNIEGMTNSVKPIHGAYTILITLNLIIYTLISRH